MSGKYELKQFFKQIFSFIIHQNFLKAALRQIAISSESLESKKNAVLLDADIQQLIKPKLKDSFLMCSSTEESYV